MRITRTANAGVLLEMDGCKILLDGVCREVYPYMATPDGVLQMLCNSYPDLVAVTHRHEDHCDPYFEQKYCDATGRQVFFSGENQINAVKITAVPSRHIGKQDCEHTSFILEGSRCVWFMGDAAPAQWRNRADLPKPDVLIAPYAYANTASSWALTQSLEPKYVVLLHFPSADHDPYGLRQAVQQTIGQGSDVPVFIPEMEGFVELNF